VRLLRSDPTRWALLLERCEPGTPLDRAGLDAEEALTAAAGVLRGLWAVPPPAPSTFESLSAVADEWAAMVRTRMAMHRPPFDEGLVELGARLLEDLSTGGRIVVLHGDFNPGNVLAAEREPWLAVDAKPMGGDAAYDVEPLLSQVDDPFRYERAAEIVRDRYRLVSNLTGQPFERLLAWSVARQVEYALWFVDRFEEGAGAHAMGRARLLADLGGL
jgi:streptomycin 6-kinase